MFSAPSRPDLAPLPQLSPATEEGQQRFLRFALGLGWGGILALDQLQEVVQVRLEEVLPIPAVDPWVLGVHSWRGDIVWILDLGALLGLEALSEAADPHVPVSAMVIPSGEQMLGLVVRRVETIVTQDPQALQPLSPGMVPPHLAHYLRGHFIDEQGHMLLQLEGERIGQALGEIESQS